MERRKMVMTPQILLLLMAGTLFFITNNLLLPTFPMYLDSLGGTETTVGLLNGLFTLVAVLLRPLFSRLVDAKGRKVVLIISAVTATTGPLLYLLGDSIVYLVIARTYHALSLSAFFSAQQTMLADLSQLSERGRVFALAGLFYGCGLAVAPGAGILIAENYGYHWLFAAAASVGLLLLLCSLMIGETHRVADQGQVRSATIVEVLRNRWVIVSSLAIFTVTIAHGAVSAFLPLYCLSADVGNAGAFFTIFAVMQLVSRLVSGRLSDKFGRRVIALPALVSVAAGLALLISPWGLLGLIISAVLFGTGFGASLTVLLVLVVNNTDLRQRSQAISFFASAFDLGVALGSMGLGPIAAHSFTALFALLLLVALVGVGLLKFYLPDTRGTTSTVTVSETQ